MARKLTDVRSKRETTPRKLTNVKTRDTYVYGVEQSVQASLNKLNDYVKRKSNNEYMTAEKLKGYRSAIADYSDSDKRLSDIVRRRGGIVDAEAEKQRNDWLESLVRSLDDDEKLFFGFKNAEEYNTEVKDHTYRSKYQGKTYAELQKELEGISARVKAVNYTPDNKSTGYELPDRFKIGNGGSASGLKLKSEEPAEDPEKLIEEYKWLENYVNTDKSVINSMSLDELENYRVKNGYKASDNPVLYYDDNGLPVYLDERIGMLKANEDVDALLEKAKGQGVDINGSKYFDYYENNGREVEDISAPEKVFDQQAKNEALAGLGTNEITVRNPYDNGLSPFLSDEQTVTASDFAYKTVIGDGAAPLINDYNEELEIRENVESLGYNWDDIKGYLEYLRDKDSYTEVANDAEQFAEDHKVLSFLWTTLGGGFKLIDLIGNMEASKYGLNNPYDDGFIATQSAMMNKNAEQVEEAFSWGLFDGKLASAAYSGIVSSISSKVTTLGTTALFGPVAGPSIGLALVGSQPAADKFHQTLLNGNSYGEAFASSLVAGLAEAGFEKLQLDELLNAGKNLDTKSISRLIWSALKQTGKQGVVEALEESGTNIVNEIADRIINDDGSVYERTVEELVYNGESLEDAKKEANKQYWEGLLSDAVGGFFGGFGPTVATNAVNVTANYSNARLNSQVTKAIGADIREVSADLESLIGAAEKITDNKEVAKMLMAVNRKATDFNVGELAIKVDVILAREFDAAKTTEELDTIREKYGTDNTFATDNYARAYENLTGKRYIPKVSAAPTAETAEGTTTPDLQSNATESKAVEPSNSGYVYSATTAEGNKVKVYGFTDNGQLKTSNGVMDVSDIKSDIRGVDTILNKAEQYEPEKAKLYVAGYEGGIDTTLYDYVFNGIYGEGRLMNYGSFEDAWKKYGKYGALSRDAAEVIYDAAREYTANERNKSIKQAMIKKGVASGKVKGKFRSRELNELVKAVAVRFGVDVEITNLNDGVNAQFVPSEGKICVNKNSQNSPKAIFHELMEAVLSYHASSAMVIQDAIISYYTEVKGIEFVNEQIENYRSAYEAAEGSKTLSEAKAELVNDAVGELFTTEDGMREFCKWLTDTDKITDKNKKNLLESFKKALEEILDFFKRFLSGSVPVNNVMREIAEMEQERATAIRKQVLEAFDMVSETLEKGNANENSTDKSESEIRNSINADFYKKFDKWVEDGADNAHTAFILGNTSEVLQKIGIKNQTIKLFSGTIIQKLNKHSEISVDCFRKIPELLENPIIVQYSDDIDPKTNKQKYDTRITVLGNLYDENGKNPVLVPLELIPLSRKNKPLEYILVVSEHTKENLQHYISNNSLLYVNPNKKVTNSWLKLNRLSLPLSSANYGYIRSITYSNGKVKIQNPKNKTAMQAAFEKAGLVDEYGNIIDKTEKKDTRSSIEVKDTGELHEDVIRENGILEDISRDVYKAYSMAEGIEISEDACRRIADTLIVKTNSLVKPEQISKDIYWLFRKASGMRKGGEQIPYDLFTRQCEDIARKLVRHSNNNERIDPKIEAALLEMKEKTVKLSDEQLKVIGKRYGKYISKKLIEEQKRKHKNLTEKEIETLLKKNSSVKSFLARNRYPFKINENADISATDFWNEMKDKYPQIFSEDVSEEMIPIAFADIAFSYGDTYMDGYGFSTSDAVAVIASELQMSFIDAVNEVKNGGVGQGVVSAIETDRKRLEAVKERYRKLTREMRNYYEDLGQTDLLSRKVRYTQQKRTSDALHTKREIRMKIKKSTDRIKSLLDHPTQNKYVPVSIMETVKQALDIMEADGFRSRNEIVRTVSRIKKVLADNEVTLGPRSTDAKKAFEKLQDVAGEEGSNVWGLDEYELILTYRAYRSLEKAILNEVQAIEGEKSRKAHDLAKQCIDDMGKDRKTAATVADNLAKKNVVTRLLFGNKLVKSVSRIPYAARKVALSECMSPEDVFDSFGCYRKGNIWRSLFKVIQNGEVNKQKIAMDANEIFSDLLDTKKYRKDIAKLNDEVDLGIKSRQDEPIKITRNMMLYIKLLLMNTDSRQTIESGGMSLPDLFELKKGNFSKAFANKDRTTGSGFDIAKAEREIRRLAALESRTTEENKKLKELRESFEGIKLKRETDVADLERMIDGVMTDYEKKWIKTAYKFFNTFSKDIVNEASVIRFGYEIADMENYCPKIVDTAFIGGMSFEGFMSDAALENMGLTKERVHSRAPIKVIGLTDVIQDHIEKIALYGGLMNPIHDFNSIYNAQFQGYEESIKNRLEKVFGKWATTYIDNLMNDLVGNRPVSKHFEQVNKFFGKLRGNVASSALVLNLPNVMEQCSSYWNAAPMVGYKNLLKACFKMGKNDWMFSRADRDLIKQYTPILENRYEGMGNVELGDIMKQKKWAGTSWGQKLIQSVASLNARADAHTAGRLWYAAEYKVQEQYPKLYEATEMNPEAYYRKVAEVYERAMLRTQAGYNVTQRPELLRTNNEIVKGLSMFMTERLKNASLCVGSTARLWRAIRDKSNVGEALAEWAVTNSSLIISAAVGELLHKLMRMVLHKIDEDERDETGEITVESFFYSYYQGIKERLIGNFWGGSEIYNAVKSIKTGERYYGPSVNGVDLLLDGITSFVDLATKAADDEKTVTAEELWKTAKEIASGMGLPARNILTIIEVAYNHFIDYKNGEFLSFKAGFEIGGKELIVGVAELVDEEKQKEVAPYVSDWLNDKALELAAKDDYSEKDLKEFPYLNNKYTDEAKKKLKSLFREEYMQKYLDAVDKKDVKTVRKIKVILYNTLLYAEKDENGKIEKNDIDVVFTEWRKYAFEKENKEAYQDAYGTGDTKTMKRIEAAVGASGFYDKPEKTLKNWREKAEEIKDAEG